MILTLTAWHEVHGCHSARTENGETLHVDFYVDGSLPQSVVDAAPESLIGRKIKVHELDAFISIAYGPELLPVPSYHAQRRL